MTEFDSDGHLLGTRKICQAAQTVYLLEGGKVVVIPGAAFGSDALSRLS